MDKALPAMIPWENKDSVRTPLSETRLNPWLEATNIIDDRVLELYGIKLDKTTANSMTAGIAIDTKTGIITEIKLDGTRTSWDLNLEKIPLRMYMTKDAVLILETDDGEHFEADLKGLIDTYKFKNSNTISFSMEVKDGTKEVTAIIRKGSITGDLLDPDYLAQIIQSLNIAQAQAQAAAYSALESRRWAIGDPINFPGSETDNAKEYANQAKKAAEFATETVKINLPRFFITLDDMELNGDFDTPLNFYIDEEGYLNSEIISEVA